MEIIDKIDGLDKRLLLFINGNNSPWADTVMAAVTERFFWIPFYFLLIAYILYTFKKKSLIILILIALTVTVADQFSSSFLKPTVGRLRPCHNETLKGKLHLVKGCGGQMGFISSHATNSFAIAIFLSLIFNNGILTVILFIWAILISFSRIYLGVHYPGDILAGCITGALIGYLFYRIYIYINQYQSKRIHSSG